MMRCHDIENLSSAYIDGELDPARSSAVRGHLRGCHECRGLVEEIALVRDAAEELGSVDPPASLWAAVERRLGEEEIADAERSRIFLWWQRAREGLRPHLLMAGVAVAVVAVLVLGGEEDDELLLHVEQSAFLPSPAAPAPAQVSSTHHERVDAEMAETDAYYASVIEELRPLADDVVSAWPEEERAAFRARLVALEVSPSDEVARLAFAEAGDTRSRAKLYAAYDAQIEFLQDVALGDRMKGLR